MGRLQGAETFSAGITQLTLFIDVPYGLQYIWDILGTSVQNYCIKERGI